MIKLSLKGFAKFIIGTPTQQRKILRKHKYPDPESFVQSTYYQEARDTIRTYHKDNYPIQWLDEKSLHYRMLALSHRGTVRTRLQHNARVIRQYAKHFSERKFEIQPQQKLFLRIGDVRISASPDMVAKERKRLKIIKLQYAKDKLHPKVIKAICQIMFEAQRQKRMRLTSSSVILLDIPRGEEHRGARMGARMRNDIEAACQNIEAIWDTI